MDVADNVVYIITIDHYLAMAAVYELVLELFHRAVLNVDGINLGSGYHTVTHLGIGKVEGIVKQLHLVLYLRVVLGIVYARLHQIVEVDLGKLLALRLLGQSDAEQA